MASVSHHYKRKKKLPFLIHLSLNIQDSNCLRIKLIGDCYYCVAGLPVPRDDHSICCVELGQQMIKVVDDVKTNSVIDFIFF